METTTVSVECPAHYNESWELAELIEKHKLGFLLGNVVKYIYRHSHKGTPVQDLLKALHYFDKYIDMHKDDEFEYHAYNYLISSCQFINSLTEDLRYCIEILLPRIAANGDYFEDSVYVRKCLKDALTIHGYNTSSNNGG